MNVGGKITITPDTSNKTSQSPYYAPTIVQDMYVYLYKDSTGTATKIYNDETGATSGYNGFTVTKNGESYVVNVPAKKDINNYKLVYTISPMTSKESSQLYHSSFGTNVEVTSNDGYADGSDYYKQNGGTGILWGQFKSQTEDPIVTGKQIGRAHV